MFTYSVSRHINYHTSICITEHGVHDLIKFEDVIDEEFSIILRNILNELSYQNIKDIIKRFQLRTKFSERVVINIHKTLDIIMKGGYHESRL